jgi:hypothetical protein
MQEQDVCQEKCSLITRRVILGIWRRNGGKKRVRERGRKRVSLGQLNDGKKDGLLKENGRKFKQRELDRRRSE